MDSEIQAYLSDLRVHQFAMNSILKRNTDLKRFAVTMSERGIHRVQDVSREVIDNWCAELSAADYSPHSVASFLTTVKLFFRFLEERTVIFEAPTKHLVIPQAKIKLGLVLSREQVKALLEKPDLQTPYGLRDKALMEVFYGGGGRLTEVAEARLQDFNPSAGTLRLFGKGAKERIIPIGTHATKAVNAYLKEGRPQFQKDDHCDALWLNSKGAPLDKQSVRLRLKAHARAAGLPAHTDTHCLRRTCATHLLRGGAHPMAVADILGHSDLQSLGHYLKTDITDLMRSHSKTNPGK